MPQWEPEVTVDEAQARALIGSQFPQLDTSELHPLGEGWDNTVWVTRERIAFRFPRRAIAVPGVEREIALLPTLAGQLPVPIPDATYIGTPSEDFRWPWFGSGLIEGRELADAGLNARARLALAPQLAALTRTLHDLALPEAASLPLDPIGRADMSVRVPRTRDAQTAIAATWSPQPAVNDLLDEAETLPPSRTEALVHGDLHARHVLVDAHGSLAGLIDWGDVCRADPAADLSLFWSALDPPGREAFLDVYGPIDDESLLRARVLALFLCAILAEYARGTAKPALEREMLAGLERTMRN
jgi:aminoglycoside phosphotransferase (APT) family kinase protein